jgi:hypothetical protein
MTTPLEAAVASAIQRAFDHTPSDDVFGDCARAAIAAIAAQGDVTDEQIIALVVEVCAAERDPEAPPVTDAVRFAFEGGAERMAEQFPALLARQAAVHAARIAAGAVLANTMILESDARADAAEAIVEAVRALRDKARADANGSMNGEKYGRYMIRADELDAVLDPKGEGA